MTDSQGDNDRLRGARPAALRRREDHRLQQEATDRPGYQPAAGRPHLASRAYLEFTGLALQSEADLYESLRVTAECATAATGTAQRYGCQSAPSFRHRLYPSGACHDLAGPSGPKPSCRSSAPKKCERRDPRYGDGLPPRHSRLLELADRHSAEAASDYETAEMIIRRSPTRPQCRYTGRWISG
jgi:hypothetical protein